MTFETPVTLDRIAKCQFSITKQTKILPQKIATIIALRLTKRFLQNKLYDNSIKSGKIYFRIKVSFKNASNIVTFARILKVKFSMLILLASSFQLEEREQPLWTE